MIWLALLAPFILWTFFLAYSALWARRKTLRPEVKAAGLVVIGIGLVIDVGFNVAASLPLMEAPQEWTFSQRMGRYKGWASQRPDHWRVRLAQYLCANWLDPFEQGGHCRG